MAETEEKVSVPQGIVPVFLSAATQEIFQAIADTDVTGDSPYKLVSRTALLEDIKNRAAVSDFKPFKDKIVAYSEEELLLVYDYDFKYGDNFYLCVTESAKDLILNPPEELVDGEKGKEEGEEEEEEPIPVTPPPREWVCLGSDKEIIEGMLKLTRPLLKYTVSRKRKYFGREAVFTDYNDDKECYTEIPSVPPSEEITELQKLEIETGIQAVPEVFDKSIQTKWCHPVNAATQYEARLFTEREQEEEWNSERMIEFLTNVTPRVELSLQQNEIIDIFPDDYLLLADDDGIIANTSDTNLKEYQSFTDLKFSKDKVVTCIDWHPTIKGIVAVSVGEPYSLNERIELTFKLVHSNSLVLIWSFTDPIHPQLFLEAPEDILCFKFNPSNPNLIAGGCINGQIVIWDITEYQDRLQINRSINTKEKSAGINALFDTEPKLDHAPIVNYVVLSSIEGGHTKGVTDIQWIPQHLEVSHKSFQYIENTSLFSSQLISCGLEGTVMFWDLRPLSTRKQAAVNTKIQPTSDPNSPYYYLHLQWKPFYKIPLVRSANPGHFAITSLSIRERHSITDNKPHPLKDTPTMIINEDTSEGVGQTTPLPYQLKINTGGTPLEDISPLLCIGAQDGELVLLNWLPGRDTESGKPAPPQPSHTFSTAHCGSIATVERSPFFRDVILTVGGWSFCIWKEGVKSDALLKSGNSSVILTGGAWSPTRPGVFFICKNNGNIDIWDLMDRSHVPSLAQNISALPLSYITPWALSSRQLMLAAGDNAGTLHILEIPWSLSHPSNNELSIMESFFEREVQRLEFVSKRNAMREEEKKKLDTLKAEAIGKGEEKSDIPQPEIEETFEDKYQQEYQQYLQLENTLLIELGIRQTTGDEN